MRMVQPKELLLLLLCLALARAADKVCPEIAAAPKSFSLEVYEQNFTLPNGRQLQGLLYNKSYIGPIITAELGTDISVDVLNHASVGTTVHWHGQDLPNNSWADGVDGISQRPIIPHQTFRYKFKAEPAGTFWYHSHVGMQFADGLRGPLVVTDPKDPYKALYDQEVVLLLTDQNSESGEEELRALQDGTAKMSMGVCSNVSNQDWSDAPFTTLLTNGKGWATHPATKRPVGSPYVIKVQKGKRYRIRTIQGAASWGMKVQVEGHGIDIIALDGANVKATPAKGFVFTPGERVDFILHANQSVGNYWINIATLTGDNSPALLSYVGADARTAGSPKLSLGCEWARDVPEILDFKNHTMMPHPTVPAPPTKADMTVVVYLTNNAAQDQSRAKVLGNQAIPGMENVTVTSRNGCSRLPDGRTSSYCWTLNWVEFQGARNNVPLLFPTTEPGNSTYVQPVPFGSVVDIVLINPGQMVHPMHIHGQRFWVLGSGNGDILTPDGKVDSSKLWAKGNAIMRDTQPVPNAVPTAAAAMGTPGGSSQAAGGSRAAGHNMASMGDKPSGRRHLLQSPGMADMPGMANMAGMPRSTSSNTSSKPSPTSPARPSPPMAGTMDTMTAPMSSSPAKPPAPDSSPAPPGPAMDAMGGMGSMEPVDTAALSPGYTVLRFKATNPGVWAFHCHIDLHANSGMMMAFKVPESEAQPWSLPGNAAECGEKHSLMADNSSAGPAKPQDSAAQQPPKASSAAQVLPVSRVLTLVCLLVSLAMMTS